MFKKEDKLKVFIDVTRDAMNFVIKANDPLFMVYLQIIESFLSSHGIAFTRNSRSIIVSIPVRYFVNYDGAVFAPDRDALSKKVSALNREEAEFLKHILSGKIDVEKIADVIYWAGPVKQSLSTIKEIVHDSSKEQSRRSSRETGKRRRNSSKGPENSKR